MIEMEIACDKCGRITETLVVDPRDANDWGWTIMDSIKRAGFECSETKVYCRGCASKMRRGAFNMILDEEREGL
jgi:hypothetical protein